MVPLAGQTGMTWRHGGTCGSHVFDVALWSHKWVPLVGPTVMTLRPCPTGGSSSPGIVVALVGPTPLTWRPGPTSVVLLAGSMSLTWPCRAEAAASALRFP